MTSQRESGAQPFTVMCFGDSNTFGLKPLRDPDDFERFSIHERWPRMAAAALGDMFDIIEEGLCGRTTVHPDMEGGAHRNGLAMLPALLETHAPLECVAIMLGTNDLKARFALSAGDIAHGARTLIEAAQSSCCGPARGTPEILLICPPVIEEKGVPEQDFRGGRDKSLGLSRAYAQVAKGCGVHFLDAAALLNVKTEDGIHFSASDHARLSAAFVEKIRLIARGAMC